MDIEPKYSLDKTKDGLSEHVKRHWGWFVLGSLACWLVWTCGEAIFYTWLAVDDPWATLRMIVEKIMTVIPGFTCAGAAVLFWEVVTNGNLLRGILHGNMACAVFASVVFFGTIFLYLRIIL